MIGARILLVEDNPVNQFVVQRMLEVLGCQVDTAEDGLEAVDLVARHRYDLILMDCLMPRMDGFEATRRIREQDGGKSGSDIGDQVVTWRRRWLNRVPIVAITTNAWSREQCLESGMDDHLRKPFDQTQLRDYVERWLPQAGTRPLALNG